MSFMKCDIHLLLYCVYLERHNFRVVGKLMKRRSLDIHINASGSLGRFIEDRMLSIQALRRSGYKLKLYEADMLCNK